jgi:hypothetical protein
VPKEAPIILVGGRLYDRADIRPARPVFRPPDDLRSPDRTEEDFRAFIDDVRDMDIVYIAVQGSATWNDTNLGALVDLLRTDREILYEDQWIVIAKIESDVAENEPAQTS